MAQKIFPGNYVNYLDSYDQRAVQSLPGVNFHQVVGYVPLTTSNQTEVSVTVPSYDLRQGFKVLNDRTSLTISASATAPAYVYRLGFRLLASAVGTTGENLKLATAHTDSTGYPVLAAASSAYAAGDVAANKVTSAGAWDAFELTSDTEYKIFVSNAGNTAAGTGISVSTVDYDTSIILCEVCYFTFDEIANSERIQREFQVENV